MLSLYEVHELNIQCEDYGRFCFTSHYSFRSNNIFGCIVLFSTCMKLTSFSLNWFLMLKICTYYETLISVLIAKVFYVI